MIDLNEFEKKIVIRNLRIEDFNSLVVLGRRCFPGMKTWLKKQVTSWLNVFPEGQIVIEYDQRLIASSSSLILDSNIYAADGGYEKLTDDGYIRNHNVHGDTLYGMEIMVDPMYRNMKLARRLYDARKELARKYDLHRIVIGGRIPGYNQYRDKMSAREYVDKVLSKEIYDSVLTSQVANGFVLKRIMSDYLDDDTASRGFATLLEWANLDHIGDRKKSFLTSSPVCVCQIHSKTKAKLGEKIARKLSTKSKIV